MIKRRLALFTILMLLMASMAIGGYESGRMDRAKTKGDLYNKVELFADALSLLRTEYVDEVDSKKLIYGAMRGMLGSLDDYSQFMEPDEYNEMKVETKGEFAGVGTEIALRDDIPTVITPMAGSPAEAAGVKPGDQIIKIDDKTTKNMGLDDSVKYMRGKSGTVVTLTIWREKEQRVITIPIKRSIIHLQSIKKAEMIDDGIGYIRIVEFQENTAADLENAMKRLEAQKMQELILDLRNNPGGLLDTAVDVAEKFLQKDKVIVTTKSRDQSQNLVIKSTGKLLHKQYPMIVIVNDGSASASEIVAGAIQDNKRGLILGTKTFGKASVQTIIPLKDGSAIRFSTASYLTPSGRIIRNQGIIPDVIVEKEEVKERKRSEKSDIFERIEEKKERPKQLIEQKEVMEKDNQLDMAVNLLKGIRVYKQEENTVQR